MNVSPANDKEVPTAGDRTLQAMMFVANANLLPVLAYVWLGGRGVAVPLIVSGASAFLTAGAALCTPPIRRYLRNHDLTVGAPSPRP